MSVTDKLEPEAVLAKTDDGRCGTRYLTASETFQASQAISLKRIADALCGDGEKGDFLTQLFHTLGDASHDHAQRMK